MLKWLLEGYIYRSWRRGRLFHRLLSELEQSEKYSYEHLVEYQNQLLRRVIKHAYKTVPYYRELFNNLGINPGGIETVEDLKILPLLRKDEVRGREKEFVSKAVKIKFEGYTSGTTGTPLIVFRDLFSINFENAAIWRQWRWAGFDFNDRRATLRGDLVVPIERKRPPFWQYIPPERQLLMSSYHLSDDTIPYYLEALRRFKPAAIQAYPSSVYRLARFMDEYGEEPIPVKAVFTSSETLFEYQSETIEKYFGKIFDFYGNAERVAFIGMCEFGTYHYHMDYSIIEFLPIGDDLFEIVGTTLHNRAMPLIRYVTGDRVRLSSKSCSCGRAFPVIESLEGRQDDYIITPSGRWIGRLDLAFKGVPCILESQIIQEAVDWVRVLIVPIGPFSYDNENLLLKRLRERLGSEIRITLEHVEKIPRPKSGKYKLVISKLARKSQL